VHSNGGKLIVQLFHCGRNASEKTIQAESGIPIAPSSVPSPIYKARPLVMDEKMISQVIISFGQAAVICREAGVDAIEISCSAGYEVEEAANGMEAIGLCKLYKGRSRPKEIIGQYKVVLMLYFLFVIQLCKKYYMNWIKIDRY
jgi:hypothetical protein